VWSVNHGSPLADSEIGGAGVNGQPGSVAGDPEVGVLDVDGHDLVGVGASDP
jgi:hypothetical protein